MSSARTPVPQPIDDFEGWLAAFAQPSVLLELASLTFCVFLAWGLVRTRPGEDNWQREGRDLGIASKWSPHLYPAIDPAVRAKLVAEGKA